MSIKAYKRWKDMIKIQIKPNEFYLADDFYDDYSIKSANDNQSYMVSVNKGAKTLDLYHKEGSEQFLSMPLNSLSIKIRELDTDEVLFKMGFTHNILFNVVISDEDGDFDFIEKVIGTFKLKVKTHNGEEDEEDEESNEEERNVYKYIIADVRKFLNEI